MLAHLKMDLLSFLILKHYSAKCSQIEIKIHRDKNVWCASKWKILLWFRGTFWRIGEALCPACWEVLTEYCWEVLRCHHLVISGERRGDVGHIPKAKCWSWLKFLASFVPAQRSQRKLQDGTIAAHCCHYCCCPSAGIFITPHLLTWVTFSSNHLWNPSGQVWNLTKRTCQAENTHKLKYQNWAQ